MKERGDGWIVFAAVVLGVAGIMRLFDSLWAFRAHSYYPAAITNSVFGSNLKTYAWIYLFVGIILILSAFGVMGQSQLSRWIGVFAGAVMSISAIWWMPFYPVWSLMYIFLGVMVIYALVVYGGTEQQA